MKFSLLSVFFFIAININLIHSQEEEEEDFATENTAPRPVDADTPYLLEHILDNHNDIHTSVKILTQRNNSEIQPGDIVHVVIGFENSGKKRFTVTDICATLTPPSDLNSFDRNFSALHNNMTIAGNEMHTFEYAFYCDEKMNPHDYGLVVAVFYRDNAGNEFTSIPYNNTITIAESTSGMGPRTFLILLSLLIGLGVYAWTKRAEIKVFAKHVYDRVRAGEFRELFNFRKQQTRKGTWVIPQDKGEEYVKMMEEREEWMTGTSSMYYAKKAFHRSVSKSPRRTSQSRPRGRSPAKS